jgi:carbon dioxide concentrating mechanism protein CcmN
MSLPIVQPSIINTPQIRGDVIIDESAIIADGVILNASLNTKIIIRAGACLGMGTIITAYEGNIEIKENVILGSGTLIVGNCIIGSQASLGASVTVYNSNIESRTVIPAGTVIGDRSRTVDLSQNIQNQVPNQAPKFDNPYRQFKISSPPLKTESFNDLNQAKNKAEQLTEIKPQDQQEQPIISEEELEKDRDNQIGQDSYKQKVIEKKHHTLESKSTNQEVAEVVATDPWQEDEKISKTVVGKVYINKLLFTLFPHKKS